MNVTKENGKLKWFCHRCDVGGTINMDTLSPEQTATIAKRIVNRTTTKKEVTHTVEYLTLPEDCVRMTKYSDTAECYVWNSSEVPGHAIHWLWGAGFQEPSDIDFTVYWSDKYQRVIFPVLKGTWLVGWVGRNVEGEKPKYLTYKKDSEKRIYYVKPGNKEHVVFTEDILSALKVNMYTGFTAVALLTTHIGLSTIAPYKEAQVYLWLDGDMLTKSVQKVQRLVQFGCKIKSIRSELDPKEYSRKEMHEFLEIKT
jgi:hypothetical protein